MLSLSSNAFLLMLLSIKQNRFWSANVGFTFIFLFPGRPMSGLRGVKNQPYKCRFRHFSFRLSAEKQSGDVLAHSSWRGSWLRQLFHSWAQRHGALYALNNPTTVTECSPCMVDFGGALVCYEPIQWRTHFSTRPCSGQCLNGAFGKMWNDL